MLTSKSKAIPAISKADAERFWSSVDRTASKRGCWLWTGSKNSKGYGRFFLDGRHYYSHRVSWALAGREVPGELQICHTCDVELCVNPDHLMMANNATNQRDAKLKRNLADKRRAIKKPRPDFPLFPHATGRWAKKINGKFRYFGSTITDPNGLAALEAFLAQKDDLFAGREPRNGQGVTCRELCNAFLTAKQRLVDSGDITLSHWHDYHGACERLLDSFGKTTPVDTLRADDFDRLRAEISKTYGPVSLGNEIQRIRSVFKWGFDSELMPAPIRFGQSFKKPSKKVRRLARKAAGPKLFDSVELREIVATAGTQLKAMILLGINCGMGQSDLATLPINRLNLQRGWHSYERPKTGTDRRCPLWPETIKALNDALADRPSPRAPEDAELVFVTMHGRRWVRCNSKGVWIDSIGLEFRKLLARMEIPAKGKSFYSLRRTFRTVADEAGDQPAAMFIMGHADDDADMSATYRQRIDDDRLVAVANHVHSWLFPKTTARKKRKPR